MEEIEDNLPPYNNPKSINDAVWGKLRGKEIADWVNMAYDETVKWKRNIFLVPTGKIGQSYIEELTKTIQLFTTASKLEEVALTMVMIMPALLLQKPSRKSKSKDHIFHLEKRLGWWREGNIDLLIREGRAIQARMENRKESKGHCEKIFVRL